MFFLPRFVGYLKEYGAKIKVFDTNETLNRIDIKSIEEKTKRVGKRIFKILLEREILGDGGRYDIT